MSALRIATILAFAAAPLAAQSPIAGVDVGRAYRAYQQTVSTMEEIARQREKIEQDPRLEQLKQLEQQVKEAEKAVAKLVSGDQEAWFEARRLAELKREELRVSVRALKESRDSATRDLNRELVTLSRKLLNDVHRAAAEVGEERGYELVVDSTGNTNTGMPLLLYTRKMPDITEAVIARLNSDTPGPDDDDAGEEITAGETPQDGDAGGQPADGNPPKAIRIAEQEPPPSPASEAQ